jgi:hypothetical protein
MNKHTPGPWIVVEHSWCDTGIYAERHAIAGLSIEGIADESNQSQLEAVMAANAKLIAAAPELLAKAQAVLAWWDKWLPTVTHKDHPECEDAEWKEFFALRRAVEQATE